jgi:hypothetical protein
MVDDMVSHADIYRALGKLEGKLDSMNTALLQRNDEVKGALDRITKLETALAKVMGACLVMSLLVPLAVTAMNPRVHFEQPSAPHR